MNWIVDHFKSEQRSPRVGKPMDMTLQISRPVVNRYGEQIEGMVQTLVSGEQYYDDRTTEGNGYTSYIKLVCNLKHVNYVYNIPKPLKRVGSAESKLEMIRCLNCGEGMTGGEIFINDAAFTGKI